MVMQPPPADSNERSGADILLWTTLGITAVFALSFLAFWANLDGILVFWTSYDGDSVLTEGQSLALTVSLLAVLAGVPCWIALAIRTISRALRR